MHEKNVKKQSPCRDPDRRRVVFKQRLCGGRDRGVAAAGDEALLAALDNNLYGTVLEVPPPALARVAAYVRLAVADLAAQPLESLLAGEVRFPDPALAGGGVP